jgi:predicted TIM-barrel fold metal-dependent hydrolase
MIVDMRLRPPLASWVSRPQFNTASYYPTRIGFPRSPSIEQRSMSLLLQEMDEAEIQWGVIMGRQSAEPSGTIPNDEIAACVNEHPDRFIAWAGIDVSKDMDWCLAEIKRCKALPGFKGASIEPATARGESSIWANDRRLYPIYEECVKLGWPINITLSAALQMNPGRPYEYSSPVQLYDVAKDFPKLDIHVGHGAWPWVMEMIGVAFVCPNIWPSPDQYLIQAIPGAQEYVAAANNYFQDRMLFGTAYPSKPLLPMVKCYREWDWAPGVLDQVFSSNALRLMKMA